MDKFALRLELPFINRLNLPNCACLFGALVVSYAGDPGKTQRHLAGVLGALLNLVIGNFHNNSGQDGYFVALLVDCDFF